MDKSEKVDDILNIAKQFVGYFEEVEEKSKLDTTNLNDMSKMDKDMGY